MINFHPFHIAVYLTLFVSVCLSNKVFLKRYLVSVFLGTRVLIDPT